MTFRACHCAKCPPEMMGKDVCKVETCNEISYTYCNSGNNFDNKTAKKVLGICVRVPFILLIFYYVVASVRLPETHGADASATSCRRLRCKYVRGGARNVVVGAAVYVVGVCLPLAFVTGLEVYRVQQFVDYRFLKRLFRRKVSVDGNHKVVVGVTFCPPASVACAVVGSSLCLAEEN